MKKEFENEPPMFNKIGTNHSDFVHKQFVFLESGIYCSTVCNQQFERKVYDCLGKRFTYKSNMINMSYLLIPSCTSLQMQIIFYASNRKL